MGFEFRELYTDNDKKIDIIFNRTVATIKAEYEDGVTEYGGHVEWADNTCNVIGPDFAWLATFHQVENDLLAVLTRPRIGKEN